MTIGRWGAAAIASAMILVVAACGGARKDDDGEAPAELPASIRISAQARAEPSAVVPFSSDVPAETAGLTQRWEFGDGQGSDAAAPSHAFAAPGDYEVVLTVSNAAGASRKASARVLVGRFSNVAGALCSGAGSDDGWCWQRQRPSGNAVHDIFFLDGSRAWAVGDAGQILRSADGGATWSAQRSRVAVPLRQAAFVDAAVGWAIGDEATVVRTDDGGATWNAQASGVTGFFPPGVRLTALDADRAVLGVPFGQSRYTIDAGRNWHALALEPTLVQPSGVVWQIDFAGSVRKSADFGATTAVVFQAPPDVLLMHIGFTDANAGWLAGTDFSDPAGARPAMWFTADAGASWTRRDPLGVPQFSPFGIVELFADASGWLVSDGALLRSSDGGANWSAVALPPAAGGISVGPPMLDAVDGTTLWFVAGDAIYLTRDAGATWTPLRAAAETFGFPERLQLARDGALWLRYQERWYRSRDAGATFQRAFGADPADEGGSVQALWFFDGRKGLALSGAGWMLDSADGGVNWSRRALGSRGGFVPARLQFAGADLGWMLLDGTSIHRSTDAGKTWVTPLVAFAFNPLADFHFVDRDRGWAMSVLGDVYRSDDGGAGWSKLVSLPYQMSALRFADRSVGVMVGRGGAIARSADGGTTWSLRASGVTHDLKRVVFTDALNGWAVGANATVLRTADAGSTWSRVPVPASVELNDVAFIDTRRGWAVGAAGTVLATADGGRTWSVQASGTTQSLAAVFFADSRTGWLGGAGGSVLATATGGD